MGAYFTPYNLTYQDLELYQKAGLKHIEWGTDSLSDIQLENYNKSFRFSDIKTAKPERLPTGHFSCAFHDPGRLRGDGPDAGPDF